jgi:putative nucleotidyltransferase with HDIG domain
MAQNIVSEKKYSTLAKFTLFYLVLFAFIYVAISVVNDVIKKEPDYKTVIPMFLIALGINIVNDLFVIKRSLTLRNIINLLVNIPVIIYTIWISGGPNSAFSPIIFAFALSWAFFFKTEFYVLVLVLVAGIFLAECFFFVKGKFTIDSAVSMSLILSSFLVGGLWIKHIINLLDHELDEKTGELKAKSEKSQRMLSNIVKTIYTALETKDTLIRKHAHRVIDYSLSIAEGLKLSPGEKEKLKTAALLHDIGKMRISDEILKKSAKLTNAEYEAVKRHPIEALNILEPIDEFQNVLIHIKYHHERWDGTGYPEGLSGETIPLLARILAVANSFDAMTSERVYQKIMSYRDAMEELKRQSGKQFDPKIVNAFIETLEKENRRKRPDR